MNDEIWFGTEAAYHTGLTGLAKYDAYVASHPDAEEREESPYLSVVDGVGIITVQGSLYDAKFGWIGAMFGVTGYGDIQEALVQAVSDTNVRSIMLVVKSGGGAVSGVNETGQLIANVDKVKPVITYSPSMMASAALWLGVSGRKLYSSDTAIVGSIGTMMIMASRAKQLKDAGVDVRVIRSGKYKALGHPAEPITDEAVEKAQAQADYLSDIFISYVADRRGTTKTNAVKTFGEGREFVGQQAVDVGLVDEVKTYSAAFTATKSLAIPDNKTKVFGASVVNSNITADNATQPQGNQMPNPHIPTPEQLAALAAGVSLDEQETDAEKKAKADAAAADEAKLKAEADAKVLEDQAGAVEKVTSLTAELATATTELATANATIAAMAASATEVQTLVTSLTALADIAKASISTMSVALGKTAPDLSAVKPEELGALHAETRDAFVAKFRTGKVAATGTKSEETKPKATMNPMFVAAANLKRVK
jgi:signal peptide peptidase SppA